MKDFRTAARRELRQQDKRPPLQKLLEAADRWQQVFVEYHQQWATFAKAERLGFIKLESGCNVHTITDKGREYLKSKQTIL